MESANVEQLSAIITRLENLGDVQGSEVVRLAPLFANDEELQEFYERHDKEVVRRSSLEDYRGTAFLGIDAGSTTFKAALIAEDGSLLWSSYANNKGDVLVARRRVWPSSMQRSRAIRRRTHRS